MRWTLGVGLMVVFCGIDTASAYTIKNKLSAGCHEGITAVALRKARFELPTTAAAIAPTDNEKALIDDLQFAPDPDMKDLGGATLMIAVRDNDLKGRGSDDLAQLAAVHGDPALQQEHCLRGEGDKEPDGTQSAIANCRTFIRGRIVEALTGLDATGQPDPAIRTTLTVALSLRGKADAPLPTYYVKIGQAIHAIEDSFTHTYRTDDERRITVTLNWLAEANGTLDESRDGPGHATALDQCDDADAIRTKRHALAIDAVTGVLRATLDPGKTSDQKLAAVDGVLDMYMSYSPGCTFANNWCDASERQYKNSGCGCVIGKGDGALGATIGAGVLALLAVRRARRRRTRAIASTLAVGALLLAPSRAGAQEPQTQTTQTGQQTQTTVTTPTTQTTQTTQTTPNPHEPPPPTIVPVKEPGPTDPSKIAFGAYLGASGSFDKASVAGTLGARLRVSKHWTFGLDGEWNPWISFNGTTFRSGVANFYATAILRFPLAYENFNIRTSVSAGASVLLMDLYGAPSGSVGPYLGVSFLGLEWKLSRAFFLIVSPVNIALPIPQLSGVPLVYPEYRFSLGIEAYFG
jgi:cell division septation protein DedD